MSAIAQPQVVYKRASFLDKVTYPIGIFFKGLRRNKAGMIGFVGLGVYAIWLLIRPLFIPCDGQVRLDQVAAPSGSRDQLIVRSADVNTYKSFTDLAGKTVGVVTQ